MPNVNDYYMTYQFLKRIITPFDQWDAYKQGVIDKEGNQLIPSNKLTQSQSNSFGYFDRITARLKQLLAKVPGGTSQLAAYAASYLLVREHNNQKLLKNTVYFQEKLQEQIHSLTEEMVSTVSTMAAGRGDVAGIGVGPQGEPPVRKKTKKKMLRRIVARG
jgi:hypothetical protein